MAVPSIPSWPPATAMSPETLTSYLHRNIPLTAAMKLTAIESSLTRVRLKCPLEPNINHHQTAFGGSLAAALMLAGWALLRIRMGADGLLDGQTLTWSAGGSSTAAPASSVRLVVSKSATDFLHPVCGDFITECQFTDEAVWSLFAERFRSNHWAKVRLQSTILGSHEPLARLKGTYVAINGNGPADYL